VAFWLLFPQPELIAPWTEIQTQTGLPNFPPLGFGAWIGKAQNLLEQSFADGYATLRVDLWTPEDFQSCSGSHLS
jgi:hypothetical protein